MLPQGACLKLCYITEAQEMELLAKLNEQKWYQALQRQVIHYGSTFKYFASEPDRDVVDIPDWIPQLSRGEKDMKNFFNQVIVNHYAPGQGIAPHIDSEEQFGDTIATLSLGSACVMDLISSKRKKISVLLPRRSLLILEGEARYEWKHGIAKRLKDNYQGREIKRTSRISITYRHDKKKQQVQEDEEESGQEQSGEEKEAATKKQKTS